MRTFVTLHCTIVVFKLSWISDVITGQKRKCSSTWIFVTMLQKEERNIKIKKCIYKFKCTECLYILKFLLYFKFVHSSCSKDICKQVCTARIFTTSLPCLWCFVIRSVLLPGQFFICSELLGACVFEPMWTRSSTPLFASIISIVVTALYIYLHTRPSICRFVDL